MAPEAYTDKLSNLVGFGVSSLSEAIPFPRRFSVSYSDIV
jgi:hypothetical protein